ncbi:MAG: hypothetical protein KAZ23_02440, partial [Burkholderiaceae bacterium]|nr:hypothetical protein [Burkholderiaceae bacterium]
QGGDNPLRGLSPPCPHSFTRYPHSAAQALPQMEDACGATTTNFFISYFGWGAGLTEGSTSGHAHYRSIRTAGHHGNQWSRGTAVQHSLAQRFLFRDILNPQRGAHIRLRNSVQHSSGAATPAAVSRPLLFRDQSVNAYRIVGAVNVYLLLALMGALTLEVIHAATGVSIGGNVVLSGKDDDYVHLIYFSLASLTTVSFGDIYVCQHFRQDAGHFFVHSGHPVSGHNHRPPGWTGFQPAFLITQLRRTGKQRGWA